MSDDGVKAETVDTGLNDLKLEGMSRDYDDDIVSINGELEYARTPMGIRDSPSPEPEPRSNARSPTPMQSRSQTPKSEDEHEEIIDAEVILKVENGKPPKLSRKSSQKIISRPAPLFDHLPDSTPEAVSGFQVIEKSIWGSKYMGASEHDALGCDCSAEWNGDRSQNNACGEDSDCINRATKMECLDQECNCGARCQNQRFQNQQWAKVSVIKTEKKGYGLRADTDLAPNDFIFEYVGEVINEPTFRRRTIQYHDEGVKHFYFMSLTKSEFVDATKKGNLGRFCNHSCNPNCYVDKWVVGDKLRMGIFAERHIKAGEELVFNYNVDRYGADPQPCYCAEPNCTGFLGGKTQTERATKLSYATIEALGIDDGDGWDIAVAKKPRKKKTGEDDEEYVNAVQPKGLDEDGVTKVMATLMQCKEKWIAVKLLSRIQRCDDDRVRNRVVRMHGYQILATSLKNWSDDSNVVLQVLDILYKFPRLTKNKIVDSKIENIMQTLTDSEHEDVAFESSRLLEEWSKLEVAYRIPRKKFDPNAQVFERREPAKEEIHKETTPTSTAPTGPKAPTGPRSDIPQRSTPRFLAPSGPRPLPSRRLPNALPPGWFTAVDMVGNTYYYSKSGQTTWQRPYLPAAEPPPPPKVPPKAVANQKALQDIIDSLTKADGSSQSATPKTPQPAETPLKEKKVEKWRSLTLEKQMKLYENTLFPHVKYVMDKYRNKLPKDDLKKFAKEIGKKLVASDFKNDRVQDPTKIDSKHEKKVKKYVKDFFDKAITKKAEHDKRKAEKKKSLSSDMSNIVENGHDVKEDPKSTQEIDGQNINGEAKAEQSDGDMGMSDAEGDAEDGKVSSLTLETPDEENLKRKRDDLAYDSTPNQTPQKRIKDDEDAAPSPPPPPPPPPAGGMPFPEDMDVEEEDQGSTPDEQSQHVPTRELTEAERQLAEQEEALMRENEEALIRENEEAMKEAEALHEEIDGAIPGSIDDVDDKVDGVNGDAFSKNVDIEMEGGDVVGDVNGNAEVEDKGVNGIGAFKQKLEGVLSH